MNSQKEIYQALINGETLRHRDSGLYLKLGEDGFQYDRYDDNGEYRIKNYPCSFENYINWEIYTPPKEKKAYYQWFHNTSRLVQPRLYTEIEADTRILTKFGEPIYLD